MDAPRDQPAGTPSRPGTPPERPVFRRRHRLAGGAAFGAVFSAKLRKSRGPLTVFLRPNGLDEHRLGLSVGRRMGGAVVRGRFKRMMREVFRHQRARLPFAPVGADGGVGESEIGGGGGGYDIVVTSRRHEPRTLAEYTRDFTEAFEAAHRTHAKRTRP